jgi:hypothetical protein
MAITKTATTFQAAATVAAGLTRATAYRTGSLDVSGYRRGTITYELANGVNAPGSAPQLVLQHSHDGGTTWRDFALVGGNTTSSGATAYADPAGMPSGSIAIPDGCKMVGAVCYGHTTNSVRLTLEFSGEVG